MQEEEEAKEEEGEENKGSEAQDGEGICNTQGHGIVQRPEWCTLAAKIYKDTTQAKQKLDFVLQLWRKIGKKIFQSCETKSRVEKLHTTMKVCEQMHSLVVT